MEKKRIIWLDIARIFACFSVIANHALDEYFEGLVNLSKPISFIFCSIQYCFARLGVPIFLMITGSLLFFKDYKFNNVLKKNNKNFNTINIYFINY